MLKAADMPDPQELIKDADGQILPAMLFYATEDAQPKVVASEYGFEAAFDSMDDYDEETFTIEDWHPEKSMADGWQFGGKWWSEDGAVAMFLKKIDMDEPWVCERGHGDRRINLAVNYVGEGVFCQQCLPDKVPVGPASQERTDD